MPPRFARLDTKWRKLSRDPKSRWCMLRNLVTSCIIHDRVRTTVARAKEARRLCDHVVTVAKQANQASGEHAARIREEARKKALRVLYMPEISMPKLFDIVAKRYELRFGGYTRIIPLSMQKDHKFSRAMLEYVDAPGDSLISRAKIELPAINQELTRIADRANSIRELHHSANKFFETDMLRPSECVSNVRVMISPSEGHGEMALKRLHRRALSLDRVRVKMERALNTPFLPLNHEEKKWPARDETLYREKIVTKVPVPPRKPHPTREQRMREHAAKIAKGIQVPRPNQPSIFYRDRAEEQRVINPKTDPKELVPVPRDNGEKQRYKVHVERSLSVVKRKDLPAARPRLHNKHLAI